jgi:hypothetical protein
VRPLTDSTIVANAVKFEVPIKDGQSTRDLKLDPDSTTWLQFSVTIAALIGCPLSSLSLGYLLNTEVKTGKKSHILESQGELTSAFKNAKKAKKAEASKGKKGKVVVVMLVDTRSAKEKKVSTLSPIDIPSIISFSLYIGNGSSIAESNHGSGN